MGQPRTFREDYATGIAGEIIVIEKLKAFFEDCAIAKQGRTARFDFAGTHFYELKTRTNAAGAFPDTIFPKSKIDYYNSLHTDKHLYLVFAFTDCIKYIKYDPETFSEFRCDLFRRGYRSDFNDKSELYYFIPISVLAEIKV